MESISQRPVIEGTWVGVDVSKNFWDVAVHGRERVERFATDEEGAEQLIALLAKLDNPLVCLEATGGWEQPLVEALHAQRIPLSVVNPRKIRDFTRARGQLAKTDKLDALAIAHFAAMMKPEPDEKPSENQEKLQSLRARRRQVSQTLVQEKNRLATQRDRDARRSIQQAVDFYQEQLEALDEQLNQLMQKDSEFRRRASLLVSVPGVGATTAATLMAEMPELGRLNRREAARLAGLAPINRDSGTLRGKRMIGGGRPAVRQGLYMATLVATKHNPVIRQFYQRLLQKGKAKMTALTACMRKLLLMLNVILRENKPLELLTNHLNFKTVATSSQSLQASL